MSELPVDAAAANRFISSLSKSLQALCHGCMDFDSGIEIGGYIYVSVDRGHKVDYVLDEMVQKSDNNSMKFISNSYLSKKDKQKQMRDGSCSPVLELQRPSYTSPAYQRNSYQYPNTPQHRSSYPYSSQVLRGAQKRAWSGMDRDWKSHRKHFRGSKPYSASQTSTSMQSSFTQPDVSNSGDVNVKTELFSNENQMSGDPSLTENDENVNTGAGVSECAMNIKNDPDAVPESDNGDINVSNSEAKEGSNDNFLQSSSEGHQHAELEESSLNASSHLENPLPSIDQSSSNQTVTSEIPTGTEQTSEQYDNSLPIQFDQSGNDMMYGQPYSEQGEASGEGAGFDVIEIDDEDEDMQAMFGDNRKYNLHLLGCSKKHFFNLQFKHINRYKICYCTCTTK